MAVASLCRLRGGCGLLPKNPYHDTRGRICASRGGLGKGLYVREFCFQL
jgi:hypothetical protein